MPLPIAQLGQPVLRQVARPVPVDEITTPEFQQLLDEMIATLDKAKGVGLAGPQVFQGKRIFLAQVLPPLDPEADPELEVFINPLLTYLSDEESLAWEGCLSFQELLVLVPRHQSLRVQYLNRRAEPRVLDLAKFSARVIQHENDHLDGILTVDRALSSHHIVKASEIKAVMQSPEFKELLGSENDEES